MRIRYISGLSNKMGVREEKIEFDHELSVLNLLSEISKRHNVSLLKEDNRPRADLHVMVNGHAIQNLQTMLENQDTVSVGYVAAGG